MADVLLKGQYLEKLFFYTSLKTFNYADEHLVIEVIVNMLV